MVKLDLYCGLLGVGKTTLIKRMLETDYKDKRVAIIENEVGKINFDSDEFKESSISVRELTSGCICCTVVGNFTKAIDQLCETENLDYIIIEPSGVADLQGLLQGCTKAKQVEINRVIMIVHTKKIKPLLMISKNFLSQQITLAQTVYLNFTEKLTTEQIEEAKNLLLEINPELTFVQIPLDAIDETTFAENDYVIKEQVVKEEDTSLKMKAKAKPFASRTSDTYVHEFKHTFSEEKVKKLFDLVGSDETQSIWRIKGYVKMDDDKARKIDYTYGDFFEKDVENYSSDKVNHLVFIGKNLDTRFLKEQLEKIDE